MDVLSATFSADSCVGPSTLVSSEPEILDSSGGASLCRVFAWSAGRVSLERERYGCGRGKGFRASCSSSWSVTCLTNSPIVLYACLAYENYLRDTYTEALNWTHTFGECKDRRNMGHVCDTVGSKFQRGTNDENIRTVEYLQMNLECA